MNKSESFKNLAEKRVNKVLEGLRLISNLSNRNNYSYTDEEVSKIFKTIQESVNESKSKFNKKKVTFKL